MKLQIPMLSRPCFFVLWSFANSLTGREDFFCNFDSKRLILYYCPTKKHGRSPINKWSRFAHIWNFFLLFTFYFFHFRDKLAPTSLWNDTVHLIAVWPLLPFRSSLRRGYISTILVIYIKSTITPQNRINFCNRVFYGKEHCLTLPIITDPMNYIQFG